MIKFSKQQNYDLEERTSKFGEEVIGLCQTVKQDAINRPVISQLIRSSTSIGANYMEANGASSKRDFGNKIYICKKECLETKHWLRMLVKCCLSKRKQIVTLWKECQELTLIFSKIASSLKKV